MPTKVRECKKCIAIQANKTFEAVPATYTCTECGYQKEWHTTKVPTICPECSCEHDICAWCGEDTKMKGTNHDGRIARTFGRAVGSLMEVYLATLPDENIKIDMSRKAVAEMIMYDFIDFCIGEERDWYQSRVRKY